MSTSGTVIHYIGCFSPLTPRNYIVLNGNFVLDLRDVFQERNPGVKRELHVIQDQTDTTWYSNQTSSENESNSLLLGYLL
jgi:hypothetical protein